MRKKKKNDLKFAHLPNVPLYDAYTMLLNHGFENQEIGLMFLDNILNHAKMTEIMQKKNPHRFPTHERRYIIDTFPQRYEVKDLSVRTDELFNGRHWKKIKYINSFAEAAAHLYLDRNQNDNELLEYFSDRSFLMSFGLQSKTGKLIEEIDVPLDQKVKMSYHSALRSLGVLIQDKWGMIVLPHEFRNE